MELVRAVRGVGVECDTWENKRKNNPLADAAPGYLDEASGFSKHGLFVGCFSESTAVLGGVLIANTVCCSCIGCWMHWVAAVTSYGFASLEARLNEKASKAEKNKQANRVISKLGGALSAAKNWFW